MNRHRSFIEHIIGIAGVGPEWDDGGVGGGGDGGAEGGPSKRPPPEGEKPTENIKKKNYLGDMSSDEGEDLLPDNAIGRGAQSKSSTQFLAVGT